MTDRLWTKAAICSLALGAISALASCNQYHSNDIATDVPPDQVTFTCPAMPACDASVTVDAAGPALVITDPQVLARVSLERVVDQLADLGFSTITATETMQRLFDTMNDGA